MVRKTEKGLALKRWFKENWKDEKGNPCGSDKNKDIKKCRPTKKVSKDTPETWSSINKRGVKDEIVKQKKNTGMGNRTDSSKNIKNKQGGKMNKSLQDLYLPKRKLQNSGIIQPVISPALRKAMEESKTKSKVAGHKLPIYEEHLNSPNYKAATKNAKEIQQGIEKGEVEAIQQKDGTYRYVSTGKAIPDDTHEMIATLGVGAVGKLAAKEAGKKIIPRLVDAGKEGLEALSKHYAPRDFGQGVALGADVINDATKGKFDLEKAVMSALRMAQAGVPVSGAFDNKIAQGLADATLGNNNPIIKLLLQLPPKSLEKLPAINRFLRGSGITSQMSGEGQGSRLDRPIKEFDPYTPKRKSDSNKSFIEKMRESAAELQESFKTNRENARKRLNLKKNGGTIIRQRLRQPLKNIYEI